eukprot:scaffold125_cov240-Pinguiococcus_pyrenoidosus.AAC.4
MLGGAVDQVPPRPLQSEHAGQAHCLADAHGVGAEGRLEGKPRPDFDEKAPSLGQKAGCGRHIRFEGLREQPPELGEGVALHRLPGAHVEAVLQLHLRIGSDVMDGLQGKNAKQVSISGPDPGLFLSSGSSARFSTAESHFHPAEHHLSRRSAP